MVSGDIYNNNGSNAGTIYCDKPIPACFGDYYYRHDTKGLVSLVPFKDEATGKLFYDSTFMVTLDNSKPSNLLCELNCDQIVIGQIYDGLCVLDKMNELIKPYAGRKYPEFIIGRSDVYRKRGFNRRIRPMSKCDRKKCNVPCPYGHTESCTCPAEHYGEPLCCNEPLYYGNGTSPQLCCDTKSSRRQGENSQVY